MPMSPYMRALREAVGPMLLEVPAVSVVLRDAAGRVLLARHSEGGVWVTPGGAVEPLETPADAAVREVWEETGLSVRLRRIVGVYGGPEFTVTYRNGDRAAFLMVVFEGDVEAGPERPDGEEILELRWFPPDAFARLELADWMRRVLADALAPRPEAAFRASTWQPGVSRRAP
jgi:8-oxo-dGTP pyrophosphatase MutT (NUDIX family)